MTASSVQPTRFAGCGPLTQSCGATGLPMSSVNRVGGTLALKLTCDRQVPLSWNRSVSSRAASVVGSCEMGLMLAAASISPSALALSIASWSKGSTWKPYGSSVYTPSSRFISVELNRRKACHPATGGSHKLDWEIVTSTMPMSSGRKWSIVSLGVGPPMSTRSCSRIGWISPPKGSVNREGG